MPPLRSTTYILALSSAINSQKPAVGASKQPFDECLAELDTLGIRTDYDLLLQSDLLEQTPSRLHKHIRTLRMAVLEHFASPGRTAADLLSTRDLPPRRIKSGIGPLDALLNGGIMAGQIVEFCGKDNNSSRSRIAIEYAAAHLTDNCTQSQNTRVFMLLSSPLSLWQVEQSLNRRLSEYPKDERMQMFRRAMERLIVIDCKDLESLLAFLFHYAETQTSDQNDFLVIDSIKPLVVNALQQQNDAHVAVNAVQTALRDITNIMRESPAAVLIINGVSQRTSRFDSNKPAGDLYLRPDLHSVQPSLGAVWAMVSHVHVYVYPELLPGDNDDDNFNSSPRDTGNTMATILKSPNAAIGQTCTFYQLHG
ncbi:hypothetical protein IWW46_001319 [Coemansia sp. RSA 2440]|nr:hypothetical protein IWW46_001319 [Coemansia sp. RSA 2440]